MYEKPLRSEFSTLGFNMVIYYLLASVISTGIIFFYSLAGTIILYMSKGSITQEEIMQVVLPNDNPLLLLIVNAIAIYAIGMPVAVFLLKKKLPSPAMNNALFEARSSAEMFSPEGNASGTDEERFGIRELPALFFMCTFVMSAGNLISQMFAAVIGKLTGIEPENASVEFLLSGNMLMTIIFVVILAPIPEELFFRKFLIGRLSHTGKWSAIFVSSMAFALYHMNIYQLFYALFVGLILGYTYVKTGKVIYTILLHISLNFTGGVLLPYFTQGVESMDSLQEVLEAGNYAFFIADGIYLLAVFAGLVCFIIYLKKGRFHLQDERWLPDRNTVLKAYFKAPGTIVLLLVCVVVSALTLSGLLL